MTFAAFEPSTGANIICQHKFGNVAQRIAGIVGQIWVMQHCIMSIFNKRLFRTILCFTFNSLC